MRAAILLECDRCGGRWCFRPFSTLREAETDVDAALAACSVSFACPGCGPHADLAALPAPAARLAEEAARAAGALMLDGRPRPVAS